MGVDVQVKLFLTNLVEDLASGKEWYDLRSVAENSS